MFNFTLDVDTSRDVMLVSWNNKSPATERVMHDLGGQWEDFNVYRLPFELSLIKKVYKHAKRVGDETKATKEFKVATKKLKKRMSAAKGLTRADSDAEISELLSAEAPETAKSLRSYQRAGVKFMSINQATLLADSPGSGKTLQTIATMISAGVSGDILVLAPSAAVQVTWPAEISRWAPDDEIICATGTRKQREAELAKLKKKSRAKRRWVLCNIEMAKVKYHKPTVNMKKGWYEYIYPELFFINPNKESKAQKGKKKEWSAIAVDESHRALITNKTQAYKQTQTRAGLGKLKTVEGGKRIAISGTPFRGKPENLWGTLNWLMPDKYKSYWPWVDRWFNTSSGYFGGTEIHEMDKSTSKRFHESFSHFTLRRTKSEIAPDLPPKVYAGSIPPGVEPEPGQDKALIGHWLEMEPKQKRAYHQMVDEAIANLDNGTLVANGVLAEMTRLKQFASCYGTLETQLDSDGYEIPVFKPGFPSNKFNWLLEFLEELGIDKEKYTPGPETNKVVIASQFTSVIDIFDEALKKKGIDTAKITGKVSAKKREEAVKSFQQDSGPRVFLLNTIAGGVSLTLDRADDIVILDETFIPDDQEQVEDRVHRVSRDHNVTVHYVRSLGTIEERIAKLTFSRDSLQKQLLDGERGIEFARKIIG